MRKSENNCRIETLSIYAGACRWQALCITWLFLALLLTQQHVAYADFTYTKTMTESRRNHTATTLTDGRVLITGGYSGATNTYRNSAEIYDPATGIFTATGHMTTARAYHTATALIDGRVLITGGKDGLSTQSLSSAEIYNPATGNFIATGNMNSGGRIFHTATRLSDGKVLVVGGNESTAYSSTPLNTAELFDPQAGTNGTFTATDLMTTPRAKHTATLLIDGTVLVAGGQSGSSTSNALNNAQIYNPATGLFFPEIGPLSVGRTLHTATLLIDGRVLLTGGYSVSNAILQLAEIFNPVSTGTGTFSATRSSLINGRINHTATRLLNGKVLIAGGYPPSNVISATTELFDPDTEVSFIAMGAMNSARAFHTAALLNNGTVVISGGISPSDTLLSAEIYDPAAIKVNPLGHTFLDAYILNESIPRNFTITNSDTNTLTLSSIGFSGTDGSMFTLDTASCGPFPFILPANGGNCSINVNFVPISRGYKSASLDIYSNDPEKPVLSAALSGTGVAVTFTIFFDGTGAGSTTSTLNGLNCLSGSGELCQAQVVPGTEISVFAAGDKHSLFEKWSDDCIVSENNGCTIMVSNDSSVTATFNYIEPAMIESFDKLKRTYYPTLLDAYDGAIAGAGNIIQARTFTFTGPLVFDQNFGVTLKGGYDLNYSSNQDYSVLNGGLIIRNGTVIVEKVVVRGGP